MTVPRVFGIPVEGLSVPSFLRVLDERGAKNRSTWIVTANPEILLETKKDSEYTDAVRKADIRMVDGFGLWALLRLSGYKVSRVAGVDLGFEILKHFSSKKIKVAFLGGGRLHSAEPAAYFIHEKFPDLQLYTEEGGEVTAEGKDDAVGDEARYRLSLFAPEILFVGFGHPKQERWIELYAHEFPSVKVVMGVGGTFDMWAGRLLRAPQALRILGLEWLWRLMLEPKRIGRILRAVITFPFYFVLDKNFR